MFFVKDCSLTNLATLEIIAFIAKAQPRFTNITKLTFGHKDYKQSVKKCLRVTNSDYTQITQASLPE
jgi:chorismate mutase